MPDAFLTSFFTQKMVLCVVGGVPYQSQYKACAKKVLGRIVSPLTVAPLPFAYKTRNRLFEGLKIERMRVRGMERDFIHPHLSPLPPAGEEVNRRPQLERPSCGTGQNRVCGPMWRRSSAMAWRRAQ